MSDPKAMDSAPKDGTKIIAAGGWFIDTDGKRLDGFPSFVAWDDLGGHWIMQDDHKAVYNEPKSWVPAG